MNFLEKEFAEAHKEAEKEGLPLETNLGTTSGAMRFAEAKFNPKTQSCRITADEYDIKEKIKNPIHHLPLIKHELGHCMHEKIFKDNIYEDNVWFWIVDYCNKNKDKFTSTLLCWAVAHGIDKFMRDKYADKWTKQEIGRTLPETVEYDRETRKYYEKLKPEHLNMERFNNWIIPMFEIEPDPESPFTGVWRGPTVISDRVKAGLLQADWCNKNPSDRKCIVVKKLFPPELFEIVKEVGIDWTDFKKNIKLNEPIMPTIDKIFINYVKNLADNKPTIEELGLIAYHAKDEEIRDKFNRMISIYDKINSESLDTMFKKEWKVAREGKDIRTLQGVI